MNRARLALPLLSGLLVATVACEEPEVSAVGPEMGADVCLEGQRDAGAGFIVGIEKFAHHAPSMAATISAATFSATTRWLSAPVPATGCGSCTRGTSGIPNDAAMKSP